MGTTLNRCLRAAGWQPVDLWHSADKCSDLSVCSLVTRGCRPSLAPSVTQQQRLTEGFDPPPRPAAPAQALHLLVRMRQRGWTQSSGSPAP
jgi:hypothetical protein